MSHIYTYICQLSSVPEIVVVGGKGVSALKRLYGDRFSLSFEECTKARPSTTDMRVLLAKVSKGVGVFVETPQDSQMYRCLSPLPPPRSSRNAWLPAIRAGVRW